MRQRRGSEQNADDRHGRDRYADRATRSRERRQLTGSARRDRRKSRGRGATGNVPTERIRRRDPPFTVVTLDGRFWIEPVTGRFVTLAGDSQETARRHYRDQPYGGDRALQSLETLYELRWHYDLKRLLPTVTALRLFTPRGNAWLNPYTGQMDAGVSLENGRLTAGTLRLMAKTLAALRQADPGLMLDAKLLEIRRFEFGCGVVPLQRAGHTQPADSGRLAAVDDHEDDDSPVSGEMAQAGQVQQHLLCDLPTIEGYRLAVHYSPQCGVGGDFYEVFEQPDGRVFCFLGDITGHGMQGALLGATCIKALRMLARQFTDPAELLVRLNAELAEDLPRGQLLTLAVSVLEPATGRLTCILCGHHPFLLANPRGHIPLRVVGNKGMAIGLVTDDRFAGSIRPETVGLAPGDVLLQYSDGLVEARRDGQEEYGSLNLYAQFLGRSDRDPQKIVDGIAKDAKRFAGGRPEDDVTLLAMVVDEVAVPAGEDAAGLDAAETVAPEGDRTTDVFCNTVFAALPAEEALAAEAPGDEPAVDDAEEVRDDAEEVREEAEAARDDAEEVREEAEAARDDDAGQVSDVDDAEVVEGGDGDESGAEVPSVSADEASPSEDAEAAGDAGQVAADDAGDEPAEADAGARSPAASAADPQCLRFLAGAEGDLRPALARWLDFVLPELEGRGWRITWTEHGPTAQYGETRTRLRPQEDRPGEYELSTSWYQDQNERSHTFNRRFQFASPDDQDESFRADVVAALDAAQELTDRFEF